MSVSVRPPEPPVANEKPQARDNPQYYRFGDFEIDTRSGELRRDGIRIRLQKKSAQLLLMLIDRPGEVVLREELRTGLWPADTFVDFDANIKTAVNRLRRVLGDSADNPIFIETVPRTGFRFVARVTRVGKVDDSRPLDETVANNQWAQLAPQSAKENSHWVSILIAGSAILILGLGFFLIRSRFFHAKPSDHMVLLVLPFEDLSSDRSQQLFSDGVTDELITLIGGRAPRELSVIARTSAMQYRGTRKSLADIARELGGTDYVLEGSVLRSGNHLGVNTELVRVSDQAVMWAQTYDREVVDLLGVQQDVAQRVSQSLFNRLLPANAATHVPDPEAHDSYLMGMYYQQNKRSGENLLKSLEYFKRAIDQDPQYAAPQAELAYSYMLAGGWEMMKPDETYPEAQAAAKRSLELDPNLAEGHVMLATAEHEYYWKWAEAETEFRRGIELNPNSSIAHKSYAEFLMHAGRNREAIDEINRAVNLDPLALGIRLLRALIYLFARDNDRAKQECEAIIRVDSQYAPAHYLLGGVYLRTGQYKEALAAFQVAATWSGDSPKMLAAVARTYALMGQREQAERLRRQIEVSAKKRYFSPYSLATIYTGLGDKTRAVNLLQQALQEHDSDLMYMRGSPDFDTLHGDPRFERMIQQIGFPSQN